MVPEAPEVLEVPEAQADLAAERSSQREACRRARLQPFAFMQELPVLIFQNDFRDAAEIQQLLSAAGFEVRIQPPGTTALLRSKLGREHAWSVIILDRKLRDTDGVECCARLREAGLRDAIVFISHADSAEDRIKAFEAGADEFITRPFCPEEMVLRLQALIRRCHPDTDEAKRCRVGETIVDLSICEALRENQRLRLTAKEADLFRYLWYHREQIVPRAELLRNVWSYSALQTRTVDMHIATLRRKLEVEPHRPKHLLTLRSQGYVLRCA